LRAGNTGARFVTPGYQGECAVEPLDSYNLSRCDFLKIDVEGAELDVLIGAESTLRRCRPVVILEVGKTPPERFGHATDAPLTFLKRLGMQEACHIRADHIYTWPA